MKVPMVLLRKMCYSVFLAKSYFVVLQKATEDCICNIDKPIKKPHVAPIVNVKNKLKEEKL